MNLQERARHLINQLNVGVSFREDLLQQANEGISQQLVSKIRGVIQGLEQQYKAEAVVLEKELIELEDQIRNDQKSIASEQQIEDLEKARKKLEEL